MSASKLPLLIETETLAKHHTEENLFILDLSSRSSYEQGHIPGALHLDYDDIVASEGPISGLLPSAAQLSQRFGNLGLSRGHHVIAYDDDSGAKACRLLWTLDVAGHIGGGSLVNGDVAAWRAAGMAPSLEREYRRPTSYEVSLTTENVADKRYVLRHLHDTDVLFLDARTSEEYTGSHLRAKRGGHIPNAVNVDWLETLDTSQPARLKTEGELRQLYEGRGITPNKEIVAYCHSNRRSAHSYFVLKLVGYPRLRAYEGSWSEWGNALDTPIEPPYNR